MSAQPSILHRLVAVLTPTPTQALGSIVIALLLLAGSYSEQLLRLLGIGDVAITATRTQLHERFDVLLSSPVASALALVTFWASVGLVAYLVCWSGYNLLIEARNEVTLTTEYTNRGHWRGHLETLALKAAGAVAFILAVTLVKPGLALWIALAAPALAQPSIPNTAIALGAAFGLALQLYVVLALALVTFTAWYRAETFTAS